jgi:hypothetical protein
MRSASWSSGWPYRTRGGGTGASRASSRPRPSHRRVNDPPDPGRRRTHARTTPGLTDLAAVPDLPGARHLVVRLPARRHRVPQTPVRLLREGNRDPAGAHPGRHRAPHQSLGRPACPQPAHGPRRTRRALQIPDPRPRQQVHACARRGIRRNGTRIIKTPGPVTPWRTPSPSGMRARYGASASTTC